MRLQTIPREFKSKSRPFRSLIDNIQRHNSISVAQLLDGFAINLKIGVHSAHEDSQIGAVFD